MTPKDLPKTELLAMLAEEAAELSHAALKLRRAIDQTNPTPKSIEECEANLSEEVADVGLCYLLLEINPYEASINATQLKKLMRWTDRLNEGLKK